MSGLTAGRVVGWWVILLLLAYACLWSAADRLAGQGLLLRVPVPLLTGGQALLARSAVAAQAGDATGSKALALRALRRRPVDAAALRAAGLAAIATGDAVGGDALMRLAGAAGWRDGPTQLYWAEVALTGGSLDVAAERLDAVERVSPGQPRARALLRRLETSTGGRAALARRWAEPNAWSGGYLGDVAGLDADALLDRLQTIRAMRGAAMPDRATLDRLGWALVERGRGDLALLLVPRQKGQWLAPFAPATDTRPGPFAWTFDPAPGLDAAVVRRGRGFALHLVASGPALLPVASQLTRLPPGVARLEGSVEGAKTALPLLATITCVGGNGAVAVPAAARPGRFAADLTVPPGCATQRLTLSVAGEEARRGAELWVGVVTLSPRAGVVL